MSKISNLDYAALNLFGDNYLQWALDTEIVLKSKGLGECIIEDNNASESNRYRAIMITRQPQANEAAEKKNLKKATTSIMINHTAVTVMDGKDVGIAKPPYTTMDIGITITVVVDPVLAMVKGEEAVAFLSHHTRPSQCAIRYVMGNH